MTERRYTPEQIEAVVTAAAEYHAAVAALRSITWANSATEWQTTASRVGICQARLLAVARDPDTAPAWVTEQTTVTTPEPSRWTEAARRIHASEIETADDPPKYPI